MTRPLRRLAFAARRAGEGDLSVRVPVEGSLEQREVAGAFNEMTARVQRMVDAQRDFVADASHQLRTPLTGLRLRLEEAAATAAGPAVEQIDGALEEVDRLSGVGHRAARAERGGRRRPPDAATDLLAAAPPRGGALVRPPTSSCPGSSSVVRCTVDDLDRILDALIENAIDYGPSGGRDRAGRRAGPARGRRRGPGLAPGEEETIFARFHRGAVGRASRRRGTGPRPGDRARARGALARRRVALANGAGGGAVATITLPLADGTHPQRIRLTRQVRHDRLAPDPRDRRARPSPASCSPRA